MTLIEYFTESHVDNIAACLRLQPDKLILVGDENTMEEPAQRYRKLLQARCPRTQVALCPVQGQELPELCRTLMEILLPELPCVIDLTGGDEMVLMAMGAVLAQLESSQREQVRVEKYDHEKEAVVDCVHGGREIPSEPVELSVEEIIALHGGMMIGGAYQPPKNAGRLDIQSLWHLVAEDPTAWNNAIGVLNELESYADGDTEIFLSLPHLQYSKIKNLEQKVEDTRLLLDRLHSAGIVTDRSSAEILNYTYNSPLLRYCIQKEGNVLEIKTLLEGRAVKVGGKPYFHDCRTSVTIDWDGIDLAAGRRPWEIPKDEWEPETRNEIDVVLMHGTTPLFISCKNGNVGEAELYKLSTVADRFGGPYAQKMLIVTELDRKSENANESFERRAWDMDVFLESRARDLSKEEWSSIFLLERDV